MSTDQRTYRAVCFDLDGTLLPMDLDEFMTAYFTRIAAFVEANGIDAARFMTGLKAGTRAMMTHTDDATNAEVFWRAFWEATPADEAERAQVLAVAERFYAEDFPHIADGFETPPAAARVVSLLHEKGYPLALTTMPMFPLIAVEHRLRWAGLEPGDFQRITHYENSKSVKPHLPYFAENLAALDVAAEDVLMVGNNTVEDLSFLELGADGYLVTDFLLNPTGMALDTVRHGSMADFEEWVATLPACADPAGPVETGPVPRAQTDAVLAACGCARTDA